MSVLDAYLQLITPTAVVLAIASGIAFGSVIRSLRPGADAHDTTYLAVVLGITWYTPQAVSLIVDGGTPWATLGRMTVFLLVFVVPMSIVLRWRKS